MNEEGFRTRTVESDGITATKTVDADGAGATVTLEATSTRSEPAVIRLFDPALEAASGDRIEMLDRDGGVARSPGDRPLGFERELGSGEAWTVTYRVTAPLPEGLDAEPGISLSDADGIEALLDRSRSDRLRAFVSGDRESLPAAGSNGTDRLPTEEHSADLSSGVSDPSSASAPSGSADPSMAADPDAPADRIARTLLAELRDGNVDRETRAALRAELRPGRTHELRLKHLQHEVSDLAVYTDMLEVFVDEYGPLGECFGELDSTFETIRDEQAALEARIETLETEFDRIDDRLDTLETFREGLSAAFFGDGGGDSPEPGE